MTFLSDKTLEKLRTADPSPDFSATRYANLQFLERGGMGAIYSADDQTLHRRVAIKMLDAPDSNGSLAARLASEARILAQLEHPGIIPVHDAGELPDGRAFYVMKFVEGSRLDQFLAGVAQVPERLRLFLRVCETVSFAHSRGILHRDIKPSNIMVGSFGEILVMDWGVAKVLHANPALPAERNLAAPAAWSSSDPVRTGSPISPETEDGMVVGTPGFMSPEQSAGKSSSLDARSDIFSLGKLLEYVIESAPPVPRSRPPKPLRAICSRATAIEPSNRYSAVSDLADDVLRFLCGAPVAALHENLWDRSLRFYRRNQAAILLILTYLLVRTLFVIYGRHSP
jgi:serine/threonine-protein kinase